MCGTTLGLYGARDRTNAKKALCQPNYTSRLAVFIYVYVYAYVYMVCVCTFACVHAFRGPQLTSGIFLELSPPYMH